ncbi:enediyne biosynthesis protein [Streptomyces sp. B8F3]|uniref:enediyne biosynthesis protein n=1 Tax=unclassified Streptomyces TaxID=2593676 RepID=UPI00325EB564
MTTDIPKRVGRSVREKSPLPKPTPPSPTPSPAKPPSSDSKPPAARPAGKDPRYLALRNFAISISVFNIIGYTLLGFEQPPLWPFLAVASAYAIDLGFESLSAWAQRRTPRFLGRGFRGVYEFLLPAHITALAVNMLLYANNQFWPVLFGVAVGVTGKYVFQAPIGGRMRHYMNPSNLGITVTLLCFGSWVSVAPPYQFGENINSLFRIAIPVILATAGTVLNAKLTGKIPLIIGWLGGFVIQAILRNALFDVALMAALGTMTGTAFLLFTNYMITDPGTTPFKPKAQFMFGASSAMVYGLLMWWNVVFTLFFALTIVCAIRGISAWIGVLIAKRRSLAESSAAPTGRPSAQEA